MHFKSIRLLLGFNSIKLLNLSFSRIGSWRILSIMFLYSNAITSRLILMGNLMITPRKKASKDLSQMLFSIYLRLTNRTSFKIRGQTDLKVKRVRLRRAIKTISTWVLAHRIKYNKMSKKQL